MREKSKDDWKDVVKKTYVFPSHLPGKGAFTAGQLVTIKALFESIHNAAHILLKHGKKIIIEIHIEQEDEK